MANARTRRALAEIHRSGITTAEWCEAFIREFERQNPEVWESLGYRPPSEAYEFRPDWWVVKAMAEAIEELAASELSIEKVTP